jgi:uncharacterized protein YggE
VATDNPQPFIEVNGMATKSVVPDEIYISICLEERMKRKEKITIAEQEKELKKAIAAVGLDLKDLSLDNLNASYIKVKWHKKDVIAKSEYTLLIRKAAQVGKLFKELDRINIQGAHISEVKHSKIAQFQKETRIAAMKAAKEKADYLLVAIDQKTGKALMIRENTSVSNNLSIQPKPVYENTALNSYSSLSSRSVDKVGEELQFDKIKIVSNVYGKFQIE